MELGGNVGGHLPEIEVLRPGSSAFAISYSFYNNGRRLSQQRLEDRPWSPWKCLWQGKTSPEVRGAGDDHGNGTRDSSRNTLFPQFSSPLSSKFSLSLFLFKRSVHWRESSRE